jgi:signal transduction histidine kinase
MKKPDFPVNEAQRQKSVERYEILDTIEEESFDNLTSLIASICDVPISLVSLLDNDRNFLKSHYGIPFNEDPRERSFCAHTILEEDNFLIVADATKDERFHDNPLVTEMGVRFYAGVSLVDSQNIRIGAFCIFGTEPKILSVKEKEALNKLSKQVMLLMESRLLNINLINAETVLKIRNQELEKFALATSHDLKSPLHNITGLLNLLEMSATKKLTEEEQNYIALTKKSANFLSDHISGLLNFYRSEQLPTDGLLQIESEVLLKEILSIFTSPENELIFHSTVKYLNINKGIISQILMNLISNGLKYNRSEIPTISVSITESNENYYFKVTDNGIGIPVSNQNTMFNLFETYNITDRKGNRGTGIGLATVKKLVTKLNGVIEVASVKNEGSVFTCIISKDR